MKISKLPFLLIFFSVLGSSFFSLSAQTFVDRQNPDVVRVVSYNMFWDELVDGPSAPGELDRFIMAVDADVWNFQECAETTAADLRNLFNQLAPLAGGATWHSHKGRNQIIVSRFPLSMQLIDVPGGMRGIAMAMVDLPDDIFPNDMYVLNNHYPCCSNDAGRIVESVAIANWIEDAKTPGGTIDLPQDTAILVLGDLNIVGGPVPLDILLDGTGGNGPDWDGTSIADSHPLHNANGPEDWTWRDDQQPFDPGILDFILYTDSVIEVDYGFILNPSFMTENDRMLTGLLENDFMLNKNISLRTYDHVPLVVDFRPVTVRLFEPPTGYNAFRGTYVSGELTDVVESDDSYLEFNPGFIVDVSEAPVWLEFEGQLPDTEYNLLIESQANTPGITYTAEMFNWNSGTYDVIGTGGDTPLDMIRIHSLSTEHVDSSSRVKARIGWRKTGFTIVFPWLTRVDQVGWEPF